MISARTLCENLSEILGVNLYLDFGEFISAYRERGNKLVFPIVGIYRPGNMVLTPLKGLVLAQMTSDVEIIGEENNIDEIRRKIDENAQINSGKTVTIEDSGKTYMLTILYSTAMVGARRDAPDNTGFCYPIRMSVNYTIVENGVSSNDVKLTIDGHDVYFTEMTVTRQRITDIFCKGTEDIMKGIVVQGGRSIDFVTPILTSEIGDIFTESIFGDDNNTAHCVFVDISGKKYVYIAVFGNTSASMRIQQNVGSNISVIEAHPELLEFSEKWAENTVTTGSYIVAAGEAETVYVFWGDGSTDILQSGESVTHSFTDGEISHTVRTFTAGV